LYDILVALFTETAKIGKFSIKQVGEKRMERDRIFLANTHMSSVITENSFGGI
jgi:hypothetical protein